MKARRNMMVLGVLAVALVTCTMLFWPSASPTTATGADSITSPDTMGDVGRYTSLVLDGNGNPVVSYFDYSNQDLKVLHCNDPNCSGGDESSTSPDTGGTIDYQTSLTLDASGNPVVSYYDGTNGDLKVLHCNDSSCAGGDESITSPDTGGWVGAHSSLALDGSGNPVVSYLDDTNDDLKVLHCNDPNCVGADESISSPHTQGNVGDYTSLALDESGNPVVSYFAETGWDLQVLHCNDPNCAGGDESITSPDSEGWVGQNTSLELDAAGNPVISYQDTANDDLKVLHCNDPNCSGGDESTTSPDCTGSVGRYTSLALDASGNPVVSYRDATTGDLKVLHCGSATCSDAKTTPTPTRGPQPLNFSIAIGGCDSTRGYDKCYIPVNTDFAVVASLDDISGLPNGAYEAVAVTVAYEGVTPNGLIDTVWPDGLFCVNASGPDWESIGCSIGIGEPYSTYTGVVATGGFRCDADGSVSLVHGTGADTLVIDDKGSTIEEAGPDVLVIKCEDGTPRPTATPMPPKVPDGDTDGDTVPNSADPDDDNDGCPDVNENGFNERLGGRRDPHNPWDYFNPTNDGKNRIEDVLILVNHYFLREGEPGYDEKYDRTAIPETAKEPWRLGPPSGQILVDDILHMIDSYRHDCGTGAG